MAAGIDRRQALKLLGGLGLAGLVSACTVDDRGGDSAEREPARIGLLVPGTGGYKPIGDDTINGFQCYLRRTGNRLGGHPVAIELVDEGDTGESALAALETLLARGVHAVVGVAGPEAMVEVSRRLEEEHIPLLGTNASPESLHNTPYVWRTSWIDNEPGYAVGRHLAATTDGPVAAVGQRDPLGSDVVTGLRQAFVEAEALDRLVEPIFTPSVSQPPEGHFADAYAQLRAIDPVAVVAGYLGAAAAAFVRGYLDAGLDPTRLYGPAHLTEGEVLRVVGADARGIRTASTYASELRTPTNRTFSTDYREVVGASPTVYAVAAYDAAAALDKALALADGDLRPQRINQNLSQVGLIDSPRGRWQFNQRRSPTQKWYLREVERDGPVLANLVIRELGTLG